MKRRPFFYQRVVFMLALAIGLSGCSRIISDLTGAPAIAPTPDFSETMYWLVDDATMRMSTQLAYELDRRFETAIASLGGVRAAETPLSTAGDDAGMHEMKIDVTSVPDAIRTKQAAASRGIDTGLDCENQMTFVADVTVPDFTAVRLGKPFTKTWRVRNTGTCEWNEGYAIVFDMGDSMAAAERTNLPSGTVVPPGETIELSVYMTAPEKRGEYAGYWKLEDSTGRRFGTGTDSSKALWVKVEVE